MFPEGAREVCSGDLSDFANFSGDSRKILGMVLADLRKLSQKILAGIRSPVDLCGDSSGIYRKLSRDLPGRCEMTETAAVVDPDASAVPIFDNFVTVVIRKLATFSAVFSGSDSNATPPRAFRERIAGMS